jgi:MYXO-CTERM domain-containing protein
MGNHNARRACGIATGLGILLFFSSDAFATRGRPKIANNTIVTDTGSLIRGARVSLDIWDETPTQTDVDTMKNSRGLNAFHIYAEYPGANKAAGYNVTKVDKVVDMADKSDLYVVLTIGSGGANGSFTGSYVTAFWAFYAPRYKDRTHVIYEVVNEPQAWSAPYNSNTLAMEKAGFTQIRGLAPDTHIMMMSYSQPNNWTQAASECAALGISWDNASVAFHTYGIDGKEDSVLTSFYKALQAKGIAYACTEPNLTLKAITTKLFERDGVSETQFINVKDIATNASAFSSWITSNNICWTPDFGTWPSCSGTVTGTGGRGAGGSSGAGGRSGTGGTTTINPGSGGRVGSGGATTTTPGTGGRVGTGGNTSTAPGSGGVTGVGGTSGSGGMVGSGGQPGSGGAGSGGAPGSGGSSSAAGGSGGDVGPLGGSGAGGEIAGDGTSNGCSCTVGKGPSAHGLGIAGGIALLLGFLALAFVRRRR